MAVRQEAPPCREPAAARDPDPQHDAEHTVGAIQGAVLVQQGPEKEARGPHAWEVAAVEGRQGVRRGPWLGGADAGP